MVKLYCFKVTGIYTLDTKFCIILYLIIYDCIVFAECTLHCTIKVPFRVSP